MDRPAGVEYPPPAGVGVGFHLVYGLGVRRRYESTADARSEPVSARR